jgi:GAF domain-containing protein
MTVFADLHAACAALGNRLFTITAIDDDAGLARRVYTSHPVEYPVSGTKPLTQDGWHATTITGRQTFVANTPSEFAKYFFDHELITSLGLGSCINIPVHFGGPVLGTVNLLAEAQHFTPDRIAAYQAVVDASQSALCTALRQALQS